MGEKEIVGVIADVDPKRLALWGHSMGRYFAPRAVAFEKRITAVVANSLLPQLKPVLIAVMGTDPNEPYGEDFESKIDVSYASGYTTALRERCGMGGTSIAAFFDNLGAYTLTGLEEKIKCPLLYISCEAEGPLASTAGRAFYEKLTCTKTEHVIHSIDGGDAHCALNNPSLKHQIEFDWLDDVLPSLQAKNIRFGRRRTPQWDSGRRANHQEGHRRSLAGIASDGPGEHNLRAGRRRRDRGLRLSRGH